MDIKKRSCRTCGTDYDSFNERDRCYLSHKNLLFETKSEVLKEEVDSKIGHTSDHISLCVQQKIDKIDHNVALKETHKTGANANEGDIVTNLDSSLYLEIKTDDHHNLISRNQDETSCGDLTFSSLSNTNTRLFSDYDSYSQQLLEMKIEDNEERSTISFDLEFGSISPLKQINYGRWRGVLNLVESERMIPWTYFSNLSCFENIQKLVVEYFEFYLTKIPFADNVAELNEAQKCSFDLNGNLTLAQMSYYTCRFISFIINCWDNDALENEALGKHAETLFETKSVSSLSIFFQLVFSLPFNLKSDSLLWRFIILSNSGRDSGQPENEKTLVQRLLILRYLCRTCFAEYEFKRKDQNGNIQNYPSVAIDLISEEVISIMKTSNEILAQNSCISLIVDGPIANFVMPSDFSDKYKSPGQKYLHETEQILSKKTQMWNDFLMFSSEFNLLICIHPGCGIGFASGSSLIGHLRKKHPKTNLSTETRKELDKYKELSVIMPEVVKANLYRPVPWLNIQNGFTCNECGFSTPSANTRRTHLHNDFTTSRIQSLCSGQLYFAVQEVNIVCNDDNGDGLDLQEYLNDKFTIKSNDNWITRIPLWDSKINQEERSIESKWCNDVPRVFEDLLKLYFNSYQTGLKKIPYFANIHLSYAQTKLSQFETENDSGSLTTKISKPLQRENTVNRYLKVAAKFLKYLAHASSDDSYQYLSVDQKECIQQFVTNANIVTLHSALISIFGTEYADNTSEESIPIYRYIVCAHCNDQGELFNPSSITTNIAALIRLNHAVFVKQFELEANPDVQHFKKYLTTELYTPFTVLVQELGYLRDLVDDEFKIGKMFWLDDDYWSVIEINGKKISSVLLQNCCEKLLNQSNSLVRQLLFDYKIPNNLMGSIKDQLPCLDYNYSFYTDPANGFKKLTLDMFSYMQAQKDKNALAFIGKTGVEQKANARAWIDICDQLTRLLFVLCHLTGGLPRRATESEDLFLCNNELFTRNIYLHEKQIFILHRYHKTEWMTGKTFVARYLPLNVSDLLIRYIVAIRPIYEFALEKIMAKPVARNFLWLQDGEPMTALSMYKLFPDMMKTMCQVSIGISEYRQVAQAFAEKHCSEDFNACFNTLNTALGHTSHTGNRSYGRTQFDIHRSSRNELSRYKKLSTQWHNFIGFGNKKSFSQSSTNQIEERKADSKPEILHMTQYNNITMSTPGNKEIGLNTDSNDYCEDYITAARCLKEIFKFTSFRSQEQARTLVMTMNKIDVISVMPTGGGKSLTYLLPAYLSAKHDRECSIIIVPLIALKHQTLNICKSIGLDSKIWHADMEFEESSDVIIVAVETARTSRFREFCLHLSNIKRLARIIVDECHTYLTWRSYRPALSDLPLIRCVPVPLLLLTASLPPQNVNDIMLAFGGFFELIRQQTTKWNMSYNIDISESSETVLSQVVSRITSKQSSLNSVVFVMRKTDIDVISKVCSDAGLNVFTFSSDTELEQKMKTINSFDNSTRSVMIATAAFGMGIDCKNIDLVIHYRGCFSMLDFVQEVGRAGRNLETYASSHIFLTATDADEIDDSMKQFINGTTCRRYILQKFLDGNEVYCGQNLACNFCDICSSLKNDVKELTCCDAPVSEGNHHHPVQPKRPLENSAKRDTETVKRLRETTETTQNEIVQSNVLCKTNSKIKNSFLISTKVSSTIGLEQMQMGQDNVPTIPQLSAAIAEDRIADNWQYIQDRIKKLEGVAAKGCLICNYNGKPTNSHTMSTCPSLKKSMCVRCFGLGHEAKKCEFKYVGVCQQCLLPGRYKGNYLHHDGTYGKCLHTISNTLGPLSMLIWRDFEAGTKTKMAVLMRYTDLQLSSNLTKNAYFNWLLQQNERDLPKLFTVLDLAIKNRWIKFD